MDSHNGNRHNSFYARPDGQMGRQPEEDLKGRPAQRYNRDHAGLMPGYRFRQVAKQITARKRRQHGQRVIDEETGS